MPAFALALWAERANRPWLWFGLLLLMLGMHGLILVIGGMALDLAVRRRWRWLPGPPPFSDLVAAAEPLALTALRAGEGPALRAACSTTSAADC